MPDKGHGVNNLKYAQDAPCPHPEKQKYISKSLAKITARRRAKISDLKISWYKCICGFWHLTSLAKEGHQEIVETVVDSPFFLQISRGKRPNGETKWKSLVRLAEEQELEHAIWLAQIRPELFRIFEEKI